MKLHSFSFFITGIYEKISKQFLINLGGGNPNTMFFPFTVAVSYILLGLILEKENKLEDIEEPTEALEYPKWKKLCLILTCTCCEILGQIFCAIGIKYAGSLLFILFYSSLTCFIALFRYFLMNVKISHRQMFGILLVTCGIAASAFGNKFETNPSLKYGIFCVLLGTLFYSFDYIGSEYVLSNKKFEIDSKEYTMVNGLFLTILLSIYMVFVTIPSWNDLVTQPIIESGSHFKLVFFLLIGLILSICLHNFSYFKMLPTMGSTNISIINAVITVGVFVLSHIFFCSTMSHQCFTFYKGLAGILVVSGVLLYST
jgi:drug/metabolite transporter (DMT)-like permease